MTLIALVAICRYWNRVLLFIGRRFTTRVIFEKTKNNIIDEIMLGLVFSDGCFHVRFIIIIVYIIIILNIILLNNKYVYK